jgi:hypothetical protein
MPTFDESIPIGPNPAYAGILVADLRAQKYNTVTGANEDAVIVAGFAAVSTQAFVWTGSFTIADGASQGIKFYVNGAPDDLLQHAVVSPPAAVSGGGGGDTQTDIEETDITITEQ